MFQRSPRRWFVLAIVCHLLALSASAQSLQTTASFGMVPSTPLGIVAVNPDLHSDSSTDTGAIAHMIYSGGPVMSNVQVVVVFWGPNVDPSVTDGIYGFYEFLVTSPFMNLLSEYSTTGLSPSNGQSIGNGTAIGPITIAPACLGCTTTPGTVTDAQITSEIQNQVSNGMLPTPTSDAFGYANTLYMVYFPPDLTITAPGAGTSCKNFCAYHSSFASNEVGRFSYGVVPDLGGSCGVCGTPPLFKNVTAVSAHEFAESISDARPNTGWYDPNFRNSNGSRGDEIADVCAWQFVTLGSYIVQPVWSNLQLQCVSGPITLSANSPTAIGPGTPFPFTVTVLASNGAQLNTYARTIHFSSSDNTAQLPADYTFTASDNGSHSFAAQLGTSGTQQINLQDVNAHGVVGQFDVNVATLVLAQATQTAGYAAGSANFLAASSITGVNFGFTVTTNDSWLHPAGNSGTTGAAFNFNYDANSTGVTRTGHISLNGGAATLTIVQQALGQLGTPIAPAILSPQGGTATITLGSNTNWTAQSVATWIHVPASGSGTQVTFTYDPNFGPTRNANVILDGTTPIALTQASSGLYFVPVTPCRVADTRNPVTASGLGGPEMTAGSTRNFAVPASQCGIPSNVQAYALNVTVVPDAVLGYLSIWPQGVSQPLVSTLNSDGRVKANAAIVPAGTNGGVSVFVSHPTHVILDVVGYFISQLNTASGLTLNPLSPCRVLDTRQSSYIAKGTSRSIAISGSCSVPATAQAYSLNLTVVPHATLGYLSAWADGQPQPPSSSLNASTGAVTANAAIVPAGTNGNIRIYASNETDLIVDTNGYFASPNTGGLSLYTLTPCRFLDTRNSGSQKPIDGKVAVHVMGSACNVPSSAQAVVLNATVVPPGDLGYLSLWADGAGQPLVSTTNAEDGAVTSNMAMVPTTNGSLDVFASDPTHVILDISSYFAP